MNRHFSAFVALAIVMPCLAPQFASAQESNFPPRRPGLWQMTIKAGPQTMTSKQCVDQTSDKKLMDMGMDAMRQRGGKMTVTHTGNTFHISSMVNIPGHTITTTEDITFVNDTTITGRGHSHINPPFDQAGAPPPDTDMSNNSKWLGPCTADMRPGDVVLPNGQRFNALTMPQGGPRGGPQGAPPPPPPQ
jgi:hypothetical protein